ncbi:AsmA family protein [Halomonas denitrificans]|nr:AsmA family protein [Halomonas denitrificans]
MRKFLIFLSAFLILLLGLWGTAVFMLDEARLKQLAVEQIEERTGRTMTLAGPLDVQFLPRIQLVARDVTLTGPPDYDGPPLFTADAFRMSVALWPLLRGQVETGALGLEDAELTLHTDRAGRTSLDGLLAPADSPSSDASSADSAGPSGERPDVRIEAIRLTDVRLVVSDARDDTVQRFLLERFELGEFRFGRPVPFTFRGEIGDPPVLEGIVLTGSLDVPPGDGPIRLSGLELAATSGDLRLGLDGSIVLETGAVPEARLEEGRVRIGDQSLAVSGRWRGTPRPSVRAEVRGESLDVDALLATLPAGDEAVPENSPSPLLVLRDMDADGDVVVDRMRLGGLPLTDVRATLVARNGVVTLDPLAAELDGGAVRAFARADLNAEPPRLVLRPSFELDSLSTALAPWGLDRFLAGAGSLQLDLSGRGLSADALLASLDGAGDYAFRDGEIRGLDLDGMVDALAARDVVAAVRDGVGGTTTFSEFSGPLAVRDGVVDLSGLTIVTERLGVGGTVRLGLADLSLDGRLRLAGERLQRVPLALGGTLTAPRLTPDLGSAVQEEAERRVMDFLQRRLQGEDESDEEDSNEEDGDGAGADGSGG